MALALPAGGKLIACDITDEFPSIGPVSSRQPVAAADQPPACACKSASLEHDSDTHSCCAGKPFWDKAGVTGKIDLRIAPAVDTLEALLKVRNDANFLCWNRVDAALTA